MIERLETERLTLRVSSEIRFESVRIHYWNVGLNGVERRSRFRNVFRDVTSTTGEHFVDRGDTILRSLHFDVVHRLRNRRN